MAKTTKKTTQTLTPPAPGKGAGVIQALIDLLTDGKGYTPAELYEKLAERKREGWYAGDNRDPAKAPG
jgi:hypothetical protein